MNRIGLSLLLLAVVSVWGWTFVLVKDAVLEYGTLPFLAVRFTIGAGCMGLLVWRRVDRATLTTGCGIGIALGMAYLLQTLGLADTTATNTGVITGLCVVFAPLGNRWLFGVRTRLVQWIAVLTSLVGLCLLAGTAPGGVVAGDWLSLGGALSFGLHIVLLDRYAKDYHAGALVFGQLLAACLLFWSLSLAAAPVTWPSPRVWFALLICAVIATAAAFCVQTFVQQRLSAVETALILLMEPLFAAVFGYALHGDRLTPIQLLGGVLMLSAVVAAEIYPLLQARRD